MFRVSKHEERSREFSRGFVSEPNIEIPRRPSGFQAVLHFIVSISRRGIEK